MKKTSRAPCLVFDVQKEISTSRFTGRSTAKQ